MKKITLYKTVIPLIVVLVLGSCTDVLNQEPRDKISESEVWQQEALVNAYVTDIYERFPFFAFGGGLWGGMIAQSDMLTERSGDQGGCLIQGGMNSGNDCFGYWDYSLIRDLNVFLEEIQNSPIEEGVKQQLEGEVRVIRAVVYFEKQKRYGGVPLVDVVLDPFEEISEEYLVRSTEGQIADFINSELELAAEMLEVDASETGRINRWTAYAYKARANLWAASIARYGNVDGPTGIEANRADEFYEKASVAANQVIDSGRFTLYEAQADPAENYRQIFLDNSNSEVIFEKLYDGVDIGHQWNHINQPTLLSAGQGSRLNPLLTYLQSFENLDGTFTNPELGPDNLYADGREPWANKDPRLHAQILLQGDFYGTRVIQTYDGLDPTEGAPNPDNIISDHAADYQGTPTTGMDGAAQEQHFRTMSGFLLLKYVTDEVLIERETERNSWKALRLAEMYLTVAEAEYELGNPDEAATFLNYTRERVGLVPLDAGSITLDRIRTERKHELAFENHRWWDLRRWRIAEDRIHGQQAQGSRIILHHDSGQFYMFPMNAESFTRTFRPEHYYNPITNSRIESQGQLVENPGY